MGIRAQTKNVQTFEFRTSGSRTGTWDARKRFGPLCNRTKFKRLSFPNKCYKCTRAVGWECSRTGSVTECACLACHESWVAPHNQKTLLVAMGYRFLGASDPVGPVSTLEAHGTTRGPNVSDFEWFLKMLCTSSRELRFHVLNAKYPRVLYDFFMTTKMVTLLSGGEGYAL